MSPKATEGVFVYLARINYQEVKSMDNKVMFNLSYGLFVLTAKKDDGASGCIINTVMQQTSEPATISITVNNSNYTNELIKKNKIFNVSIIDESADFELFKRFGFQSGRDVDKFEGFEDWRAVTNGLPVITRGCNGYISAEVCDIIELGSHTLFIANITGGEVLSQNRSVTYAYYHANIKPKTKKVESTGKVWVCKICGYVYDDAKEAVPFEELPADWQCPICKHGKEDFVLQS